MPVGYLQYGDDHPDIIEQFDCTASDRVGNLLVTGNEPIYSAAGLQLGSVADSGDNRARWEGSFLANHDFSKGVTLQFDMPKAVFAASLGYAENRILAFFDASSGTDTYVRRERGAGQDNWRMAQSSGLDGAKSINDGFRDLVTITLSHDQAGGGTHGTLTMSLDFCPFLETQLVDALQMTGNLHLGGRGNSGAPNLLFPYTNVILAEGPTVLERDY